MQRAGRRPPATDTCNASSPTTDPATLRVRVRMLSPGMIQRPSAAIVICTDRALAASYGFPPGATGLFVDVGTAAATMLLAAHALSLGAGLVSSFSRAAVTVALQLPDGLEPGADRLPGPRCSHPARHR